MLLLDRFATQRASVQAWLGLRHAVADMTRGFLRLFQFFTDFFYAIL
jgi:hypothetical protein